MCWGGGEKLKAFLGPRVAFWEIAGDRARRREDTTTSTKSQVKTGETNFII